MFDQPKRTRRRGRARMNAVTSAVGVSGIAGAVALAVVLPGSAHGSSGSASPAGTTSQNSTTNGDDGGTTSGNGGTTGQAPQYTNQNPQVTSGGS